MRARQAAEAKAKEKERPRASLGTVKIEYFRGSKKDYKNWKKTVKAQQSLYRLEEGELAMLIYLSCKGDARDCLDQLDVEQMSTSRGLREIWRLLDEAFGKVEDKEFETAENDYHSFRRTQGMTIAQYCVTLKRLKAEFLKHDPGTVISDKNFAQRMLNRASLSRRDRLDVFFSAGGLYTSETIERCFAEGVHTCTKRTRREGTLPQLLPSLSVKSPVVSIPGPLARRRLDTGGRKGRAVSLERRSL